MAKHLQIKEKKNDKKKKQKKQKTKKLKIIILLMVMLGVSLIIWKEMAPKINQAGSIKETSNTINGVVQRFNSGVIGTLEIPAINLSETEIYEGTDAATLQKGIGHYTNTSIWSGNVALASHDIRERNKSGTLF